MRPLKPLALILRGTPNSVLARPLTLGWNRMKLYGLRDTSGRLRVMFSLSVLPRSMRLGSVIAADAVTSTIVVVPATLTVMSIVAVAPAVSAMPVRRVVPNPGGLHLDIIGAQRQHREAVQPGVARFR